MGDLEESSSDVSSTRLDLQEVEELEAVPTTNEIIEDLTETTENDELLDDEAVTLPLEENPVIKIKPRLYQGEMMEESLKRNIIVAMDTGSGKTQVAVMRIQHELERLPPGQFIWFMAPTVSLCEQQCAYISSQIPSQIKFLSGADNVDRWTEQSLWDAVLKDVKVVVSTYQILLDALTHAFVRIESLALIVFDEGLTASPVMRSDPTSLVKIEETLDSLCRTPMKNRSELLLQVKLPTLSEVFYESSPSAESLTGYTKTIESLGKAYTSLKIFEDPYVLNLRKDNTEKSSRKLAKVLLNHKTWCFSQMKVFHSMALKICQELGAWAADYYVASVIAKFLKVAGEATNSLGGMWDVSNAEKQFLAKALQRVEITSSTGELPQGLPLISDKVQKLIEVLLQEPSSFRGIIFVQERVVVSVLAHLLSVHPDTRGRFRVGTMVGTSAHIYRGKNVAEFNAVDSQSDTLIDFRSGKLNLVIATSVLEEGIDVPACNVVLCFQKPANLKSFVQRRGRARHQDSKLILLLEKTLDNKTTDWHQLEMDMKKLYEDDMRVLQELMVIENSEEHDGRFFQVEKTGALLDLDNAVAHLHHFCATLPSKEYVDLRPEFICTPLGGDFIRARAILPLSVNQQVREAESQGLWKSEKNAIRDAAFQAYVALYKAGLVNDNLLPLLRHDIDVDELTTTKVETRASIMVVNDQMNPWIDVANAWNGLGNDSSAGLGQATITIANTIYTIHLPMEIPTLAPFTLYWDEDTDIEIRVLQEQGLQDPEISKLQEDTWLLHHAAYGHRFPIKKEGFVMLFSPKVDTSASSSAQDENAITLVHDSLNRNIIYIWKDLLSNKPPIQDVQRPYKEYADTPDTAHAVLKRLPRRSDFLHRVVSEGPRSKKPYSEVLPIGRCIAEIILFNHVQLGLFIPSIMHRFEVHLVAEKLSKTLLKDVEISDINLVITAISASSAREESNYQRLEFLGDSILKLCASIQLIGEYPLWHEGYLSAKKDRLVANSRLSRAALELGLDNFIITKAFTGSKWRPLYTSNLLSVSPPNNPTPKTRKLSSKILADVVESLIGAAMIDGNLPKALKCLQVFLPELTWYPLSTRQEFCFSRAPTEADLPMPETLKPLEELMGYKFRKPSLLIEALTHASSSLGTQSLERLEFLGDSILDNIIVSKMYANTPPLSHFQMHLLRTALVNADFLAFICMEWGPQVQVVSSIQESGGQPEHFTPQITTVTTPLHKHLRHTSPHLSQLQTLTARHHSSLRNAILAAIDNGKRYPWSLLARLQAHKFYSDVVESVLGAVWIDSGSLETCTSVVGKMGILAYCERILREGVGVGSVEGKSGGIMIMHPKEELGILAGEKVVRYVVSLGGGTGRDENNVVGELEGGEGNSVKGRYVCEVSVGDEKVVRYEGGVDREEVQTSAAEMAVEVLIARKRAAAVEVVSGDGDEIMDVGVGAEEDTDVVMVE
ncbi:hypothetical protein G7Y89_g12212 [Cudoniella acicularis]|uniref:Dicer-like protein 2 n=1 Tax=Cudoniella acicularis TaxID=354080 RepID=A0A8H4RBN5_9HELO|nr:hypothetical protein G7Y89_g12212 [Cudoniella acicularis]